MHLRKYIESREREKRAGASEIVKSATRQGGGVRGINDGMSKSPTKSGKNTSIN